MSFDRWIALVILSISLIYSYAAFFTMDHLLPPFMQRNPVWPSTFPKILGILSIIVSSTIVLGLEKNKHNNNGTEIDYRRILDYNLGPAIFLVIMMALYAITLRPLGFFISTSYFSYSIRLCFGRAQSYNFVLCRSLSVIYYMVLSRASIRYLFASASNNILEGKHA
jgi:putative tricarboxylic transport membrane protein